MTFLLDTNVLLHFLRGKRAFFQQNFLIDDPANSIVVSAVSIGEIRSIARRNKWGKKRLDELTYLVKKLIVIDVNLDPILHGYADIDAYSQGKLEAYPLSLSARNMGKNDLWIAATASVLEAQLLTTDRDFDHLEPLFLQIPKINLQDLSIF